MDALHNRFPLNLSQGDISCRYTKGLYQSNLHFMIGFTTLSGLRVYEIKSCKINYSGDSC